MAGEPLDRFAGGVQYPLVTPSKRCLRPEDSKIRCVIGL